MKIPAEHYIIDSYSCRYHNVHTNPYRGLKVKLFEQDWLSELRTRYSSESKYTTPFTARLALAPRLASERNKIESWFQALPEHVKPDMLSRLRSTISVQHFGAYHELVLFHYFRTLGYSVDIHQKVGKVQPDLVISGKTLDKPIIVEVATVFDEPYWEKEEHKLNLILDRLDKIEHYFHISVSVESEHIPENVNYDQIENYVKEQLDDLYSQISQGTNEFKYVEDGLHVNFSAFPNLEKTPILFSHGLPARSIGTEQVSNMITGKIKKYKIVKSRELPFAIALNLSNVPAGEKGLLDLLFGKPVIRITRDKNGHPISVEERRDYSGLLTPKPGLGGKPRNTRLSAVINLVSKWLEPESEKQQERRVHFLRIIHNNWAANPISHDIFKGCPQFVKVSENSTGISFDWIGSENTGHQDY
jgi:hypothetical protein